MPRKTYWVSETVTVKISKVKRTIKGKIYEQRIIYVPQKFADVEEATLSIVQE